MSHDTDGETALIPAEIMRYSLDKASEVNIEASLRCLASPGEPSSSIPGMYNLTLYFKPIKGASKFKQWSGDSKIESSQGGQKMHIQSK